MKECIRCGEAKPLGEFYSHTRMKDGRLNVCKDCVKKRVKANPNNKNYYLSEKGVVRTIYKTQRRHSKSRGHNPPEYTKQELSKWLYANGFKELYEAWVMSGYKPYKKPSVDRIDSLSGYSINNIRLVTWGENRGFQAEDIRNGTGSSGKRCRPVVGFCSNKVLFRFHSLAEAKRQTGVCVSNHLKRGTVDKVNNCYWKYDR